MLFVITTAITDPWTLNRKPLVHLGEISYGIYILQLPIYMLVAALNTRYIHMTPPFLFISALAVLIVAAALSYRYVEHPLREMIRKS
jgi:peptidoglycan/LPS O-acetylase OafA/YrhL